MPTVMNRGRLAARAVYLGGAVASALSCGGTDVVPPVPLDGDGAFVVGRVQTTVSSAGRTVPVEVWYPAQAGDTSQRGWVEFGLDAAQRSLITTWTDNATETCARTEVIDNARLDPADGAFPVVVMSHCHECVRFGTARIAERLASHGFVVAAPDHVGATAFEAAMEMSTGFTPATLEARVSDVQAVVDGLATPGSLGDEAGDLLEAHVDVSRVGAIGHSFGAATVNASAQADGRVAAVMALAGPIDPFGVAAPAALSVPLLSVRATEDNTIGEVGNGLIASQFAAVGTEKWTLDVEDAGHYSFLDLCGAAPQFATGCGEDQRQTDPSATFTYVGAARVRALTATYAVGFFSLWLKDDPRGRELLERDVDEAVIGPVFTPGT